jgi:hypothetical protein
MSETVFQTKATINTVLKFFKQALPIQNISSFEDAFPRPHENRQLVLYITAH